MTEASPGVATSFQIEDHVRADRVRCPLLVLQGDHDVRVPPEESDQIVEIVAGDEGDVEHVVYPEEGHGFHKVARRLDLSLHVVSFAERALISPSVE